MGQGAPSCRASQTVRATSSTITAALTAASPVGPTVNTPWLCIKMAGESPRGRTISMPISSPPMRAKPPSGIGPPNSSQMAGSTGGIGWPVAIDVQVSGGIGGRLEGAFDYAALQVNHYHVPGAHGLVAQAAGLDHDQTAGLVAHADVPRRPGDQVVARQVKVQFVDFAFQLFEHHNLLLRSPPQARRLSALMRLSVFITSFSPRPKVS